MTMTDKDYMRKDDRELQHIHDKDTAQSKILARRMKVNGSEEEKIQLEGLRLRLDEIRKMYYGINLFQPDYIVHAQMAVYHGQEAEILEQLKIIENAKEDKERVDADLQMCDKVMRSRKEQITRSSR